MVGIASVLVTTGTGVVLLVVLLLLARRRVVRFTQARAAMQERLAQGIAALRALREARRSRAGSSGG